MTACKWLVDRYAKTADPNELICTAMSARLDQINFDKSLTNIDEMYKKAGFNNKSKYVLICKAATEHSRLSKFLLFRGPGNYESL